MSDRPPLRVDRGYVVDSQVAIRTEPFGALCYHYGNRRLTFLRSPAMVALVRALGDAPTVGDALDAAGIDEERRDAYLRALERLADSGVIHER